MRYNMERLYIFSLSRGRYQKGSSTTRGCYCYQIGLKIEDPDINSHTVWRPNMACITGVRNE